MFKRFFEKVYPKLLENALSIFDIKGDVIVGVWSAVILCGCAYSIVMTKQVSPSVATIFSVVITNFSATRITQVWKGQASQVVNNVTNDVKKVIDCDDTKGDDQNDSISK